MESVGLHIQPLEPPSMHFRQWRRHAPKWHSASALCCPSSEALLMVQRKSTHNVKKAAEGGGDLSFGKTSETHSLCLARQSSKPFVLPQLCWGKQASYLTSFLPFASGRGLPLVSTRRALVSGRGAGTTDWHGCWCPWRLLELRCSAPTEKQQCGGWKTQGPPSLAPMFPSLSIGSMLRGGIIFPWLWECHNCQR